MSELISKSQEQVIASGTAATPVFDLSPIAAKSSGRLVTELVLEIVATLEDATGSATTTTENLVEKLITGDITLRSRYLDLKIDGAGVLGITKRRQGRLRANFARATSSGGSTYSFFLPFALVDKYSGSRLNGAIPAESLKNTGLSVGFSATTTMATGCTLYGNMTCRVWARTVATPPGYVPARQSWQYRDIAGKTIRAHTGGVCSDAFLYKSDGSGTFKGNTATGDVQSLSILDTAHALDAREMDAIAFARLIADEADEDSQESDLVAGTNFLRLISPCGNQYSFSDLPADPNGVQIQVGAGTISGTLRYAFAVYEPRPDGTPKGFMPFDPMASPNSIAGNCASGIAAQR